MSNVIQLHSHDRWYEIADYDVDSRTIVRVYRPEVEAYAVKTSGDFGSIGGERLVVRVQHPEQILVGFEGDQEFSLELVRIDWDRFADGKTRFVLSHGNYRHEVHYSVAEVAGEIWDRYAIDLEDFDFGLWVLNIKESPERRELLLQ